MFTGLVERVGTVSSLRRTSSGARLTVRAALEGLETGESIAVNGVCQTVVEHRVGSFSFDLIAETLRVTNLGFLRPGSIVNLERALRPGDRIGGHIVNGHVDGMGTIVSVLRNPLGLEISVDTDIFGYLVPKGSVAIDGISLTVGPDLSEGRFYVYIITHTWENTNLSKARPGQKVNIEVDILGKYVYKFLSAGRD